jgi:hypothetical protein
VGAPTTLAELKLEKLLQLRELKAARDELKRAEALAIVTDKWPDPGELAVAVDPTTTQTPALDLIDAALVDVAEGRCDRLIITMPPQEGKSTRVTTIGPLWMLTRNPDLRVAIASYAQDLADEFGRNIRNHITNNDGTDGSLDLGLRIAPDNGAARRWRIDGRAGGVRSVGIAAGLTGKSADVIFIDDPIKDQQDANSPTWRNRVWAFWRAVANTRLAPGAPVIVILTREGRRRCPEHSRRPTMTRRVGRERRVNRPSVAADPGGCRFPGVERPLPGPAAPAEGSLFKRDDWQRVRPARWVRPRRRLPPGCRSAATSSCQSWDMAFKDTATATTSSAGVAAPRRAPYLLDMVRGACLHRDPASRPALSAKWPQASAKYVEDKANGTAVINMLSRTVGGLIPVEPDPSPALRPGCMSPAGCG